MIYLYGYKYIILKTIIPYRVYISNQTELYTLSGVVIIVFIYCYLKSKPPIWASYHPIIELKNSYICRLQKKRYF